MSEPMRNHHFNRLAWVNFSDNHNCEQSLEKIPNLVVDNFNLSASKSLPTKKKTPVRITPPLPHNQLEHDLDLCKKLIKDVLDPEKEIESYIVEALESIEDEPLSP